ncbi:DUF1499 domain-containing protein [bacterium]|nr:MAG: DUF1499 domain-containing protein [bacterium]
MIFVIVRGCPGLERNGRKAVEIRVAGWAGYGFAVSLLAVISLVMAGLGTRWGFWDFRTGFLFLRAAVVLGVIGILLSLVSAFPAKGVFFTLALLGILIGLVSAGIPFKWYRMAKSVPVIHDITTDWEDPPRFDAILPIRQSAPNTAEYGGEEIAAQQRKAYPSVVPKILDDPPSEAFRKALNAAIGLGWQVVSADMTSGRIEATDTTLWFGFKDDIIIRIRPNGPGSKVDVRSVSRVGKSDVGANAKRIEKYLARLARES